MVIISKRTKQHVLSTSRGAGLCAVETDLQKWKAEERRKQREKDQAEAARLATIPAHSSAALQRLRVVQERKPWLPPEPVRVVPPDEVVRERRAAELAAVVSQAGEGASVALDQLSLSVLSRTRNKVEVSPLTGGFDTPDSIRFRSVVALDMRGAGLRTLDCWELEMAAAAEAKFPWPANQLSWTLFRRGSSSSERTHTCTPGRNDKRPWTSPDRPTPLGRRRAGTPDTVSARPFSSSHSTSEPRRQRRSASAGRVERSFIGCGGGDLTSSSGMEEQLLSTYFAAEAAKATAVIPTLVPDTVRLGRNDLCSMAGLPQAIAPFVFLYRPEFLRVLDLSSNRIAAVDPEVVGALPHLVVLLMQYNLFNSFKALSPLQDSLPKLAKLAVHGCPLHQRLGRIAFRQGVLAQVAPRSVRSLDLTPLTPLEREDLRETLQAQVRCAAVMERSLTTLGKTERNTRRAREMGRVPTLLGRRNR